MDRVIIDVKKAILSNNFLFCLVLILLSFFMCVYRNINEYGVMHFTQLNQYSIFIAGTIEGNTFLQIFAAVIPAYICMNIWVAHGKRAIKREILVTAIVGFVGYLVIFSIIFFLCILINPNRPGEVVMSTGLYFDVFFVSPLKYILIYILHSSIFGSIYAIFAYSIFLVTKNLSFAVSIPGVVYLCSGYISFIMPKKISNAIMFILPDYSFGLMCSAGGPLENSIELAFILALSLVLIIIAYKAQKRCAK